MRRETLEGEILRAYCERKEAEDKGKTGEGKGEI